MARRPRSCTQTTNADGIVEFRRSGPAGIRDAIHIHPGSTSMTARCSPPSTLRRPNTEVGHRPYAQHGPPDTPNADDSVADDPAAQGLFSVADPAPK